MDDWGRRNMEHMQRQEYERRARQAEAEMAPTAERAIAQLREQVRQFALQTEFYEEESTVDVIVLAGGERFQLTAVGSQQPNLVLLDVETSEGNFARLVQHVSQLSVLLLSRPRMKEEVRKTIGFIGQEPHASAAEQSESPPSTGDRFQDEGAHG
jgi:hypothetical protein